MTTSAQLSAAPTSSTARNTNALRTSWSTFTVVSVVVMVTSLLGAATVASALISSNRDRLHCISDTYYPTAPAAGGHGGRGPGLVLRGCRGPRDDPVRGEPAHLCPR